MVRLPFFLDWPTLMPRKKSVRKQTRADIQPSLQVATATADAPSAKVRVVASLLVVLHFSALGIALSANLVPSFLQGELLAWLSPYLQTTRQAYGAVLLEWTHAQAIDFPVAVEWQTADSEWSPLPWGGSLQRVPPSYWPNLGRNVRLIAEDQPDNELLCDIAFRLLQHAGGSDENIVAIRMLQPHVLSFDEDLIVAAGRESLIEAELEPDVFFAASVVRDNDGQAVGLIPWQAADRTAKAFRNVAQEPSP